MDHENTSSRLFSDNVPRRLKMSSREIGVAVALTFAAAVQLLSSLHTRDAKSGIMDDVKPAAFVQPARHG
jgi:hypothetical protein